MAEELTTKADFRRVARRRRAALERRAEASRQICEQILDSPWYMQAETVSCYISQESEVGTHDLVHSALAAAKRVYVPLCLDGNLKLFRLNSFDELAPRTLQILEPRSDLWEQEDRFVAVASVDVMIIPGVAFARNGARVGQGRGYYDRLLAAANGRPLRVAVAFECQIFDSVPMSDFDVRMDLIITESTIYRATPPRPFAAQHVSR